MAVRAIPILAMLTLAMTTPAVEPAGKPAQAGPPAATASADAHTKTMQELQHRMEEMRKAQGGHGAGLGSKADLQAQIDQMLRDHPELGGAMRAGGGPATPGTTTNTSKSHCTATINGKKVYDGPGSSVSVEATSDGTTTKERVVVDGKTVKDH